MKDARPSEIVPRIRQLVASAGLAITHVEYGKWAGEPGPEFQDVVVLERLG
jgi:hypothetical protein